MRRAALGTAQAPILSDADFREAFGNVAQTQLSGVPGTHVHQVAVSGQNGRRRRHYEIELPFLGAIVRAGRPSGSTLLYNKHEIAERVVRLLRTALAGILPWYPSSGCVYDSADIGWQDMCSTYRRVLIRGYGEAAIKRRN